MEGVKAIVDDILIWGDDSFEEATASHDKRLLALLERCHQKNIKLNKEKFRLRKTELFYMGVVLTDKGVKPDSKKQECIQSMPAPANRDEVRRLYLVLLPTSQDFQKTCQPSQNRYELCRRTTLRLSGKKMNRKFLMKLRPSF